MANFLTATDCMALSHKGLQHCLAPAAWLLTFSYAQVMQMLDAVRPIFATAGLYSVIWGCIVAPTDTQP